MARIAATKKRAPAKPEIYSLTPEHRAQLEPWHKEWVKVPMQTGPYSEEERASAVAALRGLYASAGLEPPPREVFAPSPICGAFAAGIASGVWWLRENPGQHTELFGRKLTEAEIQAAMLQACAVADGQVPPKAVILDAATSVATSDATSVATSDATDAATSVATSDATDAATSVATSDATSVATSDATDAATRDATRDATDAATRDATRDATDAATRDATSAATHAATSVATSDATDAATSVATYAATDAATRDATRDATRVATRAATHAATSVATSDATSVATRAATYAATHAATSDATSDATSVATDAATRDATYAATRDATRDATDAATDAATRDATYAATSDAVTAFLLGCTTRWFNLYNGGNQWSGWAEYLSFFRHVAKLNIDYSKWQYYEAAARVGPRFMHNHFWIVCARPDVLRVDEQNRPHCATGPSHRWPDGRELYYWRGTRVPGEWITNAKNVDPMLVLTHPNVEQRRCLAEIIGWTRALERLNPVVIDKHPNPEVGELLRLDPMPGTDEDPVGQFLKVRCGTGRTFVLRVPPTVTTALEAQASLWQVTPEQYARLETRT